MAEGVPLSPSHTHHDEDTETEVRIEGKDFDNSKRNYTVVNIAEIVAADGRQMVTCEIYEDDLMLASGTDSMESYVARAMDSNSDTNQWLEELLDFSDAAYTYLHRNDA